MEGEGGTKVELKKKKKEVMDGHEWEVMEGTEMRGDEGPA